MNFPIGLLTPPMLDTLEDVIIIGIVMMIPIVSILVKHQQKMALIYRQDRENGQNDERVLRELADLRQLVVQQSLAIDQLRSEKGLPPPVDSVQSRLSI
jgi:hypothetical protein